MTKAEINLRFILEEGSGSLERKKAASFIKSLRKDPGGENMFGDSNVEIAKSLSHNNSDSSISKAYKNTAKNLDRKIDKQYTRKITGQ